MDFKRRFRSEYEAFMFLLAYGCSYLRGIYWRLGISRGDVLGAAIWTLIAVIAINSWERQPTWYLILQPILFLSVWFTRVLIWRKNWQEYPSQQLRLEAPPGSDITD